MAKNRFRVYLEKDPKTGIVAARCLEMSVFSQGKNEREALKNIKESIRLHLEVLDEEVAGKKLVEVAV